MKLENNELFDIKGGAVKKAVGTTALLIIGGVITLLIGIVDGLVNPTKCGK